MDSQNKGRAYRVTICNETTNQNETIQVRSDERIIDVAEQHGISLPYSCRAGSCISCTAKLQTGRVEHDYSFLTEKEEAEGFILTCTASPRADCIILTHQEDELLEFADRT